MKKRNNNNILYISSRQNPNSNKLYTIDELRVSNNLKKQYKRILNKENVNFNVLKEKKLIIKPNNNSNNKSLLKDKNNNIITNIFKNSNFSQVYDKNQISFIKKNNVPNRINEPKKNLIHLKTPPKENNNFNFYVINNIINKDKYFQHHKKFETLNYDNKTLAREIAESNEIKSFINKKYSIIKNKDKEKDNELILLCKNLTKTKNSENKNNKEHLKIKPTQILEPLQLNAQLKINRRLKQKEELNKFNKIKVNLKSNNSDLHCQKSPVKTVENNIKKDLKKIIPKLKLEGINNKIKEKNINSNTIIEENNIFNNYNKTPISNNYSNYMHNNIRSKDYINENISSINNRSGISNNKSKIYQRKNNTKKNCIINKNNKNYLKTINCLNKDLNILIHQRNLSSALKSKLSYIKTENNFISKSNKKSFIIKGHSNSNKKSKVIKNNKSININNSYMNDFYGHNLKKRKSSIKSEDNNLNSYAFKPINTKNSLDKNINKNISKKTSYVGTNRKYIINKYNEILRINNSSYINPNINRPIKKEYYINNNNQNVININMVLKQNKNKYKNRNLNDYLISSESISDTSNNINIIPSPYFTENISIDNNSHEKYNFNLSTLSKKNDKKKNKNKKKL